uniref:NADH-ubiquinone oxidoreductase chain 2 n=1 Tax=Doriprismatica atromarginata TaxID=154629 RepID=A0A895KU24_DORAT|nr:NADH dehydrogenase subunit 2 [Doriprismatica atromarginata]QRZ60636.1 NADH dehydrogenase subunit 2 [Doriprismatica atromarginata]
MSSANILFLLVLVLGPIVSISSPNWVVCWVGMELSFLGAVPLLLNDKLFFSLSKESVIKYFCIQALGSGLLMLGGVMYYMDFSSFWFWDLLFVSSLFMKLGVFPMHFWVPSVTAGLNWIAMFILLGWQKVAPFAFLVNVLENSPWLKMAVVVFGGISSLIGAIIGLNQTSVRAMLGSSSIVHTGWGCIGSVFGGLWVYFLIYCGGFFLLMVFFLIKEEMMIGFGILSLSGLPPFMMFIGKWTILKNFLYCECGWMFLVLPLVGALLSLFFYLKFFYSFYLSSENSKMKSKYFEVCSVILVFLTGVVYLFFI